jgi:hypothetical protein
MKRPKTKKQDKQSGQTTGETHPKDLRDAVALSTPEGSAKSSEAKGPENIKSATDVTYIYPIRVQEVENWENLFKVQG